MAQAMNEERDKRDTKRDSRAKEAKSRKDMANLGKGHRASIEKVNQTPP
jgi:hypothetical protein